MLLIRATTPSSPEDVLATLYRCLGLPTDTLITDPLGRPLTLCEGKPIQPLLA